MTDTQRVSIGTRKGLFIYDLVGGEARLSGLHHTGVPVVATCVDNPGNLWACLGHGHWSQKLSRSPDGGKSWQAVEPPAVL
ncbi:MAG: hypothetical protein OEZ06_31530 [Myxococcales bacterium]|nr:hypothetical protein [Myxococcales bacterium]